MADTNDSTTETQTTTTGKESTTQTQTAGGQQAADSTTGAATQTAQQSTEASTGKAETTTTETKIDTSSPEFKAALTAAIQAKIPQLQKQARAAVAKELSGEKEGEPTVEDLKRENADKDLRLRRYEARDQVDDYVSDKRNNVSVRNMKALIRYVEHDFEYDEQGKVTNLKDLITRAKLEVPELFGGTSSSIDAGNGSRQQPAMDMNAWMRGGK